MGKVKNRQSDSFQPGMVSNDSAVISKNKKRKDRRLSHNVNIIKSNSGVSPSKKLALGPVNKFEENQNLILNLPAQGKKKENKLLSASLPIKGGKKSAKSNDLPLKKNAVLTGILNNANSPKKKSNNVTFSVEKDDMKFIDSEAEEGEEPINDKIVKSYEKRSQKKNLLKRKMSLEDTYISDEETDSDDSFANSEDFVDMEASEGEETDESDDSADDESGSEIDSELSDFIGDEVGEKLDDDDDDDDDDDNDDEEDDNDDDSEDEAETDAKHEVKAPVKPARRESVILPSPKKEKKDLKNIPQPNKVSVKLEPVKAQQQQKSAANKKNKENKSVQKGGLDADSEQVSRYVGFIRKLRDDITEDALKSALSTKIKPQSIVKIIFQPVHGDKLKQNAFVHMKDEESLLEVLNNKFVINEKNSFTVYKARETIIEKKEKKFLAFLPRIPISITAEALQEALAKDVGADGVQNVKFRKTYKNLQMRNVLVEFSNLDALQKIVVKGECKVGDVSLIVRTAFESGIVIPTYKVLFTSVPEKTSEAALKTAIESLIGKNTVLSVRFSVKKPSFAFVSLKSEEAKKKVLEVGQNVSIKGAKLQVTEFVPNRPKSKRAPPNQQAKDKKKNARKRKAEGEVAGDATKPAKKRAKKNKANAVVPNGVAQEAANSEKNQQKNASEATATKKENKKEPSSSLQPKAKGARSKKNKPFPNAAKYGNVKQNSQSPAEAAVNGDGSPSPKQKKKNKRGNQPSPKPVEAKKKALALKLQAKKKNKQKGVKKE